MSDNDNKVSENKSGNQNTQTESLNKSALMSLCQELFASQIISSHSQFGDDTLSIAPINLLSVVQKLQSDPRLDMDFLMDLTAVDYLGEDLRFEVVYHFYSSTLNHRLRLKLRVSEDNIHAPSLVSFYKSADWMEREVFDMYGIVFDNHGDLRRILMYDEFVGHPLRKDYPIYEEQPIAPYIAKGGNNFYD